MKIMNEYSWLLAREIATGREAIIRAIIEGTMGKPVESFTKEWIMENTAIVVTPDGVETFMINDFPVGAIYPLEFDVEGRGEEGQYILKVVQNYKVWGFEEGPVDTDTLAPESEEDAKAGI